MLAIEMLQMMLGDGFKITIPDGMMGIDVKDKSCRSFDPLFSIYYDHHRYTADGTVHRGLLKPVSIVLDFLNEIGEEKAYKMIWDYAQEGKKQNVQD